MVVNMHFAVCVYLIIAAASPTVRPASPVETEDVVVVASNAVKDFQILESLTDDEQPALVDVAEASTSRVLIAILRRGKELIKMLPRLGVVIAKRFLDRVPTPGAILNFGKQTLIGLPQEVIAYAIDVICNAAVSYKALKPLFSPSIHEMNYILITPENDEITVPLKHSHGLWSHPLFREEWPVVIIVTGWNSNINVSNEALETLYAAYRCREQYNFVVIDTAQFVDTLYTWSAFSSKPVGQIVGEALVELTQYVPVRNVHLIGHSLGAHICAEAGRTFQSATNRSLARITGLDPARPCFSEGERISGLQRGDADFVDIIHSNAGILGVKDPIGDVDFYPNGRDPLQPGCWSIFCAHSRSYYYFAESVYPGNENNFLATKCNSISAYRQGRCAGRTLPMGIATPATARGSYYLETNKKSPYGRPSRKAPSRWWWFGRRLIAGNSTACGQPGRRGAARLRESD